MLTITQIKHPATLISPSNVQSIKTSKWASHIVAEANKFTNPRAITCVNIGFGGTGIGHIEFTGDAKHAYANALAYIVTNNNSFAENTLKILNAWSTICTTFIGPNAPLEAAWGTATMSRSCELLKYTYINFNHKTETLFINWVKKLLLPHLRGETERYKLNWGFFNNWHTSINEARLQFGLLCNDLTEVNMCINRYHTIFNSYVQDSGVTGETYRDSDHCCFGLAGLIQTCELAFHQGIDLYKVRNNLLHKCIELHAGIFNRTLPDAIFDKSKCTIYKWIQPSGWEIIFRHFVKTKGLQMPHTQQLLNKVRPCGFELHWGYDTLTHG